MAYRHKRVLSPLAMETIYRAMVAQGLSQAELAARAQLSRGEIVRILSGDRTPRRPTLERLSSALDIPLGQLLNADDGDGRLMAGQIVEVPVLRQSDAAHGGSPTPWHVYVTRREALNRDLHAVEVESASMVPDILPNDVVIVDRKARPESGDVVAASLETLELVIERYVRNKDVVQLRSNIGDVRVIPEGRVRIEGVVVRVIRDVVPLVSDGQ